MEDHILDCISDILNVSSTNDLRDHWLHSLEGQYESIRTRETQQEKISLACSEGKHKYCKASWCMCDCHFSSVHDTRDYWLSSLEGRYEDIETRESFLGTCVECGSGTNYTCNKLIHGLCQSNVCRNNHSC